MSKGSANGDTSSVPDPERCPECDADDAWKVNRRHRFSPFGAVLLAVLAFWIAIGGWAFGFGYIPSGVLLAGATVVAVATRKAEICKECGLVRPSHR